MPSKIISLNNSLHCRVRPEDYERIRQERMTYMQISNDIAVVAIGDEDDDISSDKAIPFIRTYNTATQTQDKSSSASTSTSDKRAALKRPARAASDGDTPPLAKGRKVAKK
ncbi:hypothetical protein HPB52_025299 [Rhipicephalus sanguineus]|uniref:Uncharacterized protein n=1 Tax=Rhipicephalus sanguineus TaxID=34632 RepID=A0A9D4YRI5_RHISA|nr:hypothetical protein HPB52_025299 [Rhipicephalus sanguineus]